MLNVLLIKRGKILYLVIVVIHVMANNFLPKIHFLCNIIDSVKMVFWVQGNIKRTRGICHDFSRKGTN